MAAEGLKKDYWALIRKTRQSGRISPALICKVEAQWGNFDDGVVEEALLIHMARHREEKERYTLGIMRNLQKQKDSREEGAYAESRDHTGRAGRRTVCGSDK